MSKVGFVYIVQGEDEEEDRTAPVKIGFARDVHQRMRSLQTGNPDRLRLLVCFPGTRRHERRLHERFADARIHDEWFRYTPDLESFVVAARVELLTTDAPIPAGMPMWYAPGFEETFEVVDDDCVCEDCFDDNDEVRP